MSIVNLGDITNQAAWTQASYLLSSPGQLRFRIQASDGPTTGDLVEGGLDDVEIRSVATCTTGGGDYPGEAKMLSVAKSSTNLNLVWTALTGCSPTGYGLYRGSLPWTGYNHTSINCAISGTSITTPQDTGSYYFLIVPTTAACEGSYGKDSAGNERPQGSNPCRSTQCLNPC